MIMVTMVTVPALLYVTYWCLQAMCRLCSTRLNGREKGILWLRHFFVEGGDNTVSMFTGIMIFVVTFVFFIYAMHLTIATTSSANIHAKSQYATDEVNNRLKPAREALLALNNTLRPTKR
jgi:hypothetical protein